MKVRVNLGSGFSMEVEGSDDKTLFKAISEAQKSELFMDTKCGCCKSENIKFQVRTVEKDGDTNDFYEKVCKDCGAKLNFGHSKSGGMYAKKMVTDKKGKSVKDENGKGKPLPNNGWNKYQKKA